MNNISILDLAWIGTLLLVSGTVAMWMFVICARWWRARSSARRIARQDAAEAAILSWGDSPCDERLQRILSLKPRLLLNALSVTLPKIEGEPKKALLAALCRSSFAKYVRRHFNKGDETERLLCCEILGAIGGDARSTLLSALSDPAPSVRIGAAIGLAHSGGLPPLAETLGRLGPAALASSRLVHFFEALLPERRPEIMALVRNFSVNSQVRVSALTAFAWQEGDDLIHLLKELADDGESSVVVEVARLLGDLDHSECSPILAGLLTKNCVSIRRAAAQSLGSVGDDEFSYTLLPVLLDEDHFVRHSAARSMDRLAILSGRSAVALNETRALRSSTDRMARSAA